MKKIYYLFLLPLLLNVTACSSYQKSIYLRDDQVINQNVEGQLYDFRIMPKDVLTILVSTTDPSASAPFYRRIGQEKGSQPIQQGMQNADLLNYLVDNEGMIDLPVLGKIKVIGLTTRECETIIRDMLKNYLNEVPNVTVRSSNYKFSVLGEVNKPGIYTVDNEKVTLFEALAKAGDMTLFSVRNDVQLLREDSVGRRYVVHLDLNDAAITQSPYFYLQQNDVIYVKPTKAKVRTNTFNSNASMWITILSVLTSISTLVLAITK